MKPIPPLTRKKPIRNRQFNALLIENVKESAVQKAKRFNENVKAELVKEAVEDVFQLAKATQAVECPTIQEQMENLNKNYTPLLQFDQLIAQLHPIADQLAFIKNLDLISNSTMFYVACPQIFNVEVLQIVQQIAKRHKNAVKS